MVPWPQAIGRNMELEIQLIERKRAAPPGRIATGKRPRRAVLTALAADTCGTRVSLSHAMLRRCAAPADDAAATPDAREPPSPAAVFRSVATWVAARRLNVLVRHLPVDDTADATTLPVVYVFDKPHRAYLGERHLEQCADYVQRRTTEAAEVVTTESVGPATSSSSAELVRSFLSRFHTAAPQTPEALRQISVEQQQCDIERLCTRLGVPLGSWPAVPCERAGAPPATAAVVRKWLATPDEEMIKPGRLVQLLGWGNVDPGLLVLMCMTNKLDGWQWPMNSSYPKAATWCLRRALVATRGLRLDHAVMRRIYQVLNISH